VHRSDTSCSECVAGAIYNREAFNRQNTDSFRVRFKWGWKGTRGGSWSRESGRAEQEQVLGMQGGSRGRQKVREKWAGKHIHQATTESARELSLGVFCIDEGISRMPGSSLRCAAQLCDDRAALLCRAVTQENETYDQQAVQVHEFFDRIVHTLLILCAQWLLILARRPALQHPVGSCSHEARHFDGRLENYTITLHI
jgi:hypothetical protein